MHTRLCAALIAWMVGANAWGSAVTATPPPTAPLKPLTPLQQKQKRCTVLANARHLSGAPRRVYLKSCLK